MMNTNGHSNEEWVRRWHDGGGCRCGSKLRHVFVNKILVLPRISRRDSGGQRGNNSRLNDRP